MELVFWLAVGVGCEGGVCVKEGAYRCKRYIKSLEIWGLLTVLSGSLN